MKMSDVPKEAFSKRPTKIPTKKVESPDWEAFYEIVKKQGYVIVECAKENIRVSNVGGEEAVPVKAFNSWVRGKYGTHVKSKRICTTLWFVTL